MNKFSTWLWRTAFWLRYKVGYGLKVYGRDNFLLFAAMHCLGTYTLWQNRNYL